MSDNTTPKKEEGKASPYRWVILLLAFLPCCLASVCQFQVTPYAADLMSGLGITEQQYATIATAPMLVGVFLSLLAGTLGDRIGVKKVVFIALVITAVGALCRAFAPNYQALLLFAILMGVAGVVLNSNNAKLMSSWFSPKRLGLAIGVIVAAGNGGTILAMAIGTSLGDYKTAFLIGGIAFAVVTILWLLFMKERKIEQPVNAPTVKMSDIFKSRNVWIAALGAAFYMGLNMAVSALLSPGLVSKGVDSGTASITIIIFSVTALLGSILMPNVINRLPNTKISCSVLAIIAGISLYLAWIVDSSAARMILIAICGIAAGGLLPTIMSVPAILPEIGPAKMGAAGGLISTVMMAGAFLIPSYVITPIAGGINDTAFLIAALCGAVVAVIFILLPNVSAARKQ